MRIKLGHLRQIIREAVGSPLSRDVVRDMIKNYKAAVAAYKNAVGDARGLDAMGTMIDLEKKLIALRDAAKRDVEESGLLGGTSDQIVMDINRALSGEVTPASGTPMTDKDIKQYYRELFPKHVPDTATRPFSRSRP